MEPRLDRPTSRTPPAAAEPARMAGSSYPRWWLVLAVWAAWGPTVQPGRVGLSLIALSLFLYQFTTAAG